MRGHGFLLFGAAVAAALAARPLPAHAGEGAAARAAVTVAPQPGGMASRRNVGPGAEASPDVDFPRVTRDDITRAVAEVLERSEVAPVRFVVSGGPWQVYSVGFPVVAVARTGGPGVIRFTEFFHSGGHTPVVPADGFGVLAVGATFEARRDLDIAESGKVADPFRFDEVTAGTLAVVLSYN